MQRGFRVDNRGVSGLVGAVLLLGILVIALASYQAVIVPQQNAQTEFDHNQQVEDEMVELRNALLEARLDNRERATAVKLGTRYRDRTIAVNPPPATGRLDSTPEADMVVEESGSEVIRLPDNRFVEYTSEYAEYRDAGTIRYENTVVYHAFDTANVTLSDQRLVTGDVIRLVPAAPSIDENGVDTVTYEPSPSRYRVYTAEDPTITVPTDLSQSEWVELLSGQDYESLTVSSGTLTLEFDGIKEIRYAPVDGQGDFPGDQRGDDDGDDGADEINPAAPGDVRLIGVTPGQGNSEVILTFENLGTNEASFVSGRVNFYYGQGGGDPAEATEVCAIGSGSNPRGTNWEAGTDFRPLNPPITVAAGDTTSVAYVFDKNYQTNNDYFITTLEFDTGERGTYFIAGDYGPDVPNVGDACANGNDNSANGGDGGSFEFTSTSASQSGNDPADYSFTVSAGSADITSVTVELLENGSNG